MSGLGRDHGIALVLKELTGRRPAASRLTSNGENRNPVGRNQGIARSEG